MKTLTERLIERKARMVAQHIEEGGTVDTFIPLWQRLEPLELADLAMNPESEGDVKRMTATEKVELRAKIGDAEFTRRIQEGR